MKYKSLGIQGSSSVVRGKTISGRCQSWASVWLVCTSLWFFSKGVFLESVHVEHGDFLVAGRETCMVTFQLQNKQRYSATLRNSVKSPGGLSFQPAFLMDLVNLQVERETWGPGNLSKIFFLNW